MEEPIVGTRTARWQTYATAFAITTLIFGTAFYTANYFNNLRVEEIRIAQDNVFTDILSLETQFALLAANSCRDISENSVLSKEITPLGARIAYLEAQESGDQADVARLKRYYSLLQIKDLLLMQEVSEKCGLNPIFILYFYSNQGDCEECEDQGHVLTGLSKEYPQLRVYSFDYHLDISALKTLTQINDVAENLPALVIKDNVYYGFRDVDGIKEILPELATLEQVETNTSADL